MLRLIRTCVVSVLALQLVMRFLAQFVTVGVELVSVTDLCLMCLIVTTSYMGIACDEKPLPPSFPRLYKRR